VIADGGGAISSLTKVGSGTLTLTGANTYTGNTSVEGGTLSISSAYLADGADVLLSGGGILNLGFGGSPDTIDSLYIDGMSMVTGTWGAPGNMSAANHSPLLSGTGVLNVLTVGPPLALAGDHNNDGVVDAADYVAWRKDPGAFGGEPGGYDTWRENFGNSNPGSGGANGSELGSVPEPATCVLVAMMLMIGLGMRRRS
jgi:autotransporter-associated beta strand protein